MKIINESKKETFYGDSSKGELDINTSTLFEEIQRN